MSFFKKENGYILLAIFLTLVIFILDSFILQDTNVNLLYVFIVLLTINLKKHSSTIIAGALTTLITIIGYSISTHITFPYIEPFINRVFTITAIWGTVVIMIIYKRSLYTSIQNRERLNALFHHSNEGIIITNNKGEIININPAIKNFFGYEKEELEGKQIEILIPNRFTQKHKKHRKSFYENPHPRPMGKGHDLYGKRKDDSEFPVQVSLSNFNLNNELYVISFIIDITEQVTAQKEFIEYTQHHEKIKSELEKEINERTEDLNTLNKKITQSSIELHNQKAEKKEIESALRESQNLHRTIVKSFSNGFVSLLDSRFQFIFIDGKDLGRLGINRSNLIAKSFFSLFTTIDQDKIEKKLYKVLDGFEANFIIEFNLKTLLFHANLIPNEKSTPPQILVVAQDITKQKRIEANITNLLEKEIELSSLKSRFVSTASHEFRTPLGTILSSASLIEKYNNIGDEDNRKKHINRIKTAVANMNDLMNDFLSIGKIEEGKHLNTPEEFDVTILCNNVKKEMRHLLKMSQIIHYEHTGDSTIVFLDKNLLENILRNLLSNAIKFSETGKQILLKSNIKNGTVQFTVKDEGMGIPEEDKRHIFETFYRAKNATNIQGTGLGLNIIQKYLELMGGSIDFESREFEGSKFTVKFYQQNKIKQL